MKDKPIIKDLVEIEAGGWGKPGGEIIRVNRLPAYLTGSLRKAITVLTLN